MGSNAREMKTISDPRLRRFSEYFGVIVFCLIAATSIRFSHSFGTDFHAFYCAGVVTNENADPYRVEPLRDCENDIGLHRTPLRTGFAVPAPLPGYDIAFFKLVARLPYPIAAQAWQIVLWICVGVAVFALSAAARTPPLVAAAATAFSDGYVSSLVGNVVPIAVAAVALGAWCASRGRYRGAVFCVALSMCEPHIGLGSLAALAVFVPAARWSAGLCTLTLLALTYSATGIALTTEYLRDVLPRHVLSEITSEGQYSLTHLLHVMGFSDSRAAGLGEASYFLALGAGIIVAGRLRAVLHDDAFLVAIPPAFALIGGPFVHLIHMAIALPAAFLLYARAPQTRPLLGWCIMLLAIPWTAFAVLLLGVPIVFVAAFLAWTFIDDRRWAAIATAGEMLILFVAKRTFQPSRTNLSGIVAAPNAFAEDAWRQVIDALFTGNVPLILALQVPTWCGLLGIAWAATRLGLRP